MSEQSNEEIKVKRLKVLVGCECSGVVRDAFLKAGHDAFSCDILPSRNGGPHFEQDLIELLKMTKGAWDLGIFHPPCDFLTNSAAWAYADPDFEKYPGCGYHQQVKYSTLTGQTRREARERAVQFFMEIWNSGIPALCIENPIGFMNTFPGMNVIPQIIQPWAFNEDASKATCLWLKGLPHLRPTGNFPPRIVEHKGKMVKRWSNQTDSGQNRLSPSDDRASVRAVTYQGIANAMADQWSKALTSP